MVGSFKNTAKKRIRIDGAISCSLFETDQVVSSSVEKRIACDRIQFFFVTEGCCNLAFGAGDQPRVLSQGQSFLHYKPLLDTDLRLMLHPGAKLFVILTEIDEFHRLFGAEDPCFLGTENAEKAYQVERDISPGMAVILSQLAHCELNPNLETLYAKAKIYELFCLYFQASQEKTAVQCPFLLDAENVDKIRQARSILIENMANPPSLKSLSQQVGLNEYRLKVGFKKIYGNTIYGFLMDYKMEYARRLIEEEKIQVKEVAYSLGYENPSHFIAAFKKKYGVTPKKYAIGQ